MINNLHPILVQLYTNRSNNNLFYWWMIVRVYLYITKHPLVFYLLYFLIVYLIVNGFIMETILLDDGDKPYAIMIGETDKAGPCACEGKGAPLGENCPPLPQAPL